MNIPIDGIRPNPKQPRRHFDPEGLNDLAQSIREHGVLIAVIVEGPFAAKAGQSMDIYYLVDGERRWRAAKLAGLESIPAEVRVVDELQHERLILALIANLQREDLNPIEEAEAFQSLREAGLSNNQIGLTLGIRASRVADRLKLMELDPEIRPMIIDGSIPKDLRFVDALLELPTSELRIKTARGLAERRANVKAGVEACQRILEHTRERTIGRDDVPAVVVAVKKEGNVRRSTYDVFAQVGKVPPWLLVALCAKETCDDCAMRDAASAVVCRECPLADFLRRLIGKTK